MSLFLYQCFGFAFLKSDPESLSERKKIHFNNERRKVLLTKFPEHYYKKITLNSQNFRCLSRYSEISETKIILTMSRMLFSALIFRSL